GDVDLRREGERSSAEHDGDDFSSVAAAYGHTRTGQLGGRRAEGTAEASFEVGIGGARCVDRGVLHLPGHRPRPGIRAEEVVQYLAREVASEVAPARVRHVR